MYKSKPHSTEADLYKCTDKVCLVSDAAEDDCYKCSRWDNVGNGYLPSDIPKQCSIYRQCYRTQGSTVITGPIYR